MDDHCLARKPHVVNDFLRTQRPKIVSGFSVDVKDLYYSLPQKVVFEDVSASIDRHGAVKFQNTCAISVVSFMELFTHYLRSTLISHKGSMFIQREGICIRSSLAPILSDLHLPRFDRSLMQHYNRLTRSMCTVMLTTIWYCAKWLMKTNGRIQFLKFLTCFKMN